MNWSWITFPTVPHLLSSSSLCLLAFPRTIASTLPQGLCIFCSFPGILFDQILIWLIFLPSPLKSFHWSIFAFSVKSSWSVYLNLVPFQTSTPSSPDSFFSIAYYLSVSAFPIVIQSPPFEWNLCEWQGFFSSFSLLWYVKTLVYYVPCARLLMYSDWMNIWKLAKEVFNTQQVVNVFSLIIFRIRLKSWFWTDFVILNLRSMSFYFNKYLLGNPMDCFKLCFQKFYLEKIDL